jgi:hypothetical protein
MKEKSRTGVRKIRRWKTKGVRKRTKIGKARYTGRKKEKNIRSNMRKKENSKINKNKK